MEIGSIKPVLTPVTGTDPLAKSSDMTKVEGFSTDARQMETRAESQQKSEEDLQEAVDKLNKTAVIFDRSLRFQVHDKTHRTMVSVVDISNDKVIRQIPNEEVLDLVAKMDDYLGLIFDKKA